MKAWSALVILAALTAAYFLNPRETTQPAESVAVATPAESAPVAPEATPSRSALKPVQDAKLAQADDEGEEEDPNATDGDDDEQTALNEAPPAAIAEPQAQLQPTPPVLVPELPLWTPAKPKPQNDMWTLREVRKADMSDRTLFLITYGQSPKPNFKIEAWEPGILAPGDH